MQWRRSVGKGTGGGRRRGWAKGGGRRGGGGGKNKKYLNAIKSFTVEGEDEDEGDEEVSPLAPIEASQLTAEQQTAATRALRGESLFLTGAAGTGKSFLLRYLVQELERLFPTKVAVTAPTGIAAANVGGQTIHSFGGVGLGDEPLRKLLKKVERSKDAVKRWTHTRVLVVDEISMLDAGLFESLNAIAKKVRGSPLPFGGLQVIFCGDFLQLPPVQGRGEARRLFCFQAPSWAQCGLDGGTVMLEEMVRQSGDQEFAEVLNEVRRGIVSDRTVALLESCSFDVKPVPQDGIIPTKLYCKNKNVDAENLAQLERLPGKATVFRSKNKSGVRDARLREAMMLTLDRKVPAELRLKQGAQVILVKNQPNLGLVNGSRGVVEAFREGRPVVRFDSGQSVCVGKERFEQGTGKSKLLRIQVPLKLGWALTVHKAQGMTLSRAELQVDDAFEAGQAYVALSRLTSSAGLWLRGSGLSAYNTRAHPDVLGFYDLPGPGENDLPAPRIPGAARARRARPAAALPAAAASPGAGGSVGSRQPRKPAAAPAATPRKRAGAAGGRVPSPGSEARQAAGPGGEGPRRRASAKAASGRGAGSQAKRQKVKAERADPPQQGAVMPEASVAQAAPAADLVPKELRFFPQWEFAGSDHGVAAGPAGHSRAAAPAAIGEALAAGRTVPVAAGAATAAPTAAATAKGPEASEPATQCNWVEPPASWGGLIVLDDD